MRPDHPAPLTANNCATRRRLSSAPICGRQVAATMSRSSSGRAFLHFANATDASFKEQRPLDRMNRIDGIGRCSASHSIQAAVFSGRYPVILSKILCGRRPPGSFRPRTGWKLRDCHPISLEAKWVAVPRFPVTNVCDAVPEAQHPSGQARPARGWRECRPTGSARCHCHHHRRPAWRPIPGPCRSGPTPACR